jgi:acyl-CoA thioester hydrolase
MAIVEDTGPRREVHRTRIEMRWGDMDALGHLNNAIYFRYFEQSRAEWLRASELTLAQRGEGLVVVNAWCNFRREVNFPASLEVIMFTGAPGRSSFPTYYELRDADGGDIYADGGYGSIAMLVARSPCPSGFVIW